MNTFKPIKPLAQPRFDKRKAGQFFHDLMAGFGLGMTFFCIYLIVEPFVR